MERASCDTYAYTSTDNCENCSSLVTLDVCYPKVGEDTGMTRTQSLARLEKKNPAFCHAELVNSHFIDGSRKIGEDVSLSPFTNTLSYRLFRLLPLLVSLKAVHILN